MSPVRVSMRIGSPISRDRRFEVARDVDRERLQRRDVERVQALRAPQVAAGGDAACAARRARSLQFDQRRQEARQRLAAAGRRDQQHRAAGLRLGQQFELMRARRPAARREPAARTARAATSVNASRCRASQSGAIRRAIAPLRTAQPNDLSAGHASRRYLLPTPSGVCCKPGGFHIDPTRPVEQALITHGHSDHARAGHGAVLATQETLDIMRLRYGENFAGATQAVALRRDASTLGGVTVTLPSGRPRARLGADRGRTQRPAHRRLRRLQGRARSDLRAVRAGALRRVHHRGDVRPAGVPPSAMPTARSPSCCTRSRCFPSARIWSAPIRSARRSA